MTLSFAVHHFWHTGHLNGVSTCGISKLSCDDEKLGARIGYSPNRGRTPHNVLTENRFKLPTSLTGTT